jgi:hypothetical protein
MSLSKNMIPVKLNGSVAYEERDAGEAGIYPGMIVKIDTDGDVIKNNSQEVKVPLLVAIEDSLQGNLSSTVYTLNYPVRIMQFKPGEEFHGRLATHMTVSVGELLTADGAGCFKAAADSGIGNDQCVAMALEAADTDATNSELVLMRAI